MKKYWSFVFIPFLVSLPVVAWSADPGSTPAEQSEQDTSLKGTLALSKSETIKSLDPRQVRILYTKDNVPTLGILQYSKEGVSWVPAQGAPVKLPYKLSALVSANGRTILQYGDKKYHQHPDRIDLYFFDENGKEIKSIVDHFGPFANVVMAGDGHVAVAGTLFKDEELTGIGLYSPTGETRFQTQLADDRRANIAVPTSQGQRVAIFTTDKKDALAKHRLEILDGEGKQVAEHSDLGILQKAVAVADGSLFFIQAKGRFGLLNASDGTFLWKRNESLHLISPFGAVTDPEGKTLFLATAGWDGIPRARYRWRIEVRDVATGNKLAQFILPDAYPSSSERVFLNVTSAQIEVLAGDERIVLDWRRP
jgi:outer membrane protein assembly factor BamB